MKTILYQPLFINPQAYFVFPQLYHIEKGDSYIEPANITGQLIINDLTKSLTLTPILNVVQDTNQVDFGLFKGKHIRISQYTNIGSVVLGEWYIPGTPTPPEPEQPDWFKESIIAWYSPKKQKLTNYDVIESYAEDFTRWRIDNTGVTTTQKKITIAANTELKYNIAYKGFGNSTDGFDIKYTGNIVMRYRYHKEDGTEDNITIDKSGIYHLPASVRTQKNFGFYCNPQTVTEEATIEQLPTSILKDFSGNGLDAYMYGFQGKLNSGMGVYNNDFTDSGRVNFTWVYTTGDITVNGADSFTVHNNREKWVFRCTTNVKPMTVKIVGVSNDINFKYRYESKNGEKWIFFKKDGIYELPATIGTWQGFNLEKNNDIDVNITVTQIPDYPNQLCYSGKEYCVSYNQPILTDYTVIADRTWFKDKIKSWSYFIDKSKAFVFERTSNGNNFSAKSFAAETSIKLEETNVSYQTKTSYNGNVINYHNDQYDNDDRLVIGSTKDDLGNQCFIGCHGDIFLFNRTLTEYEISWVKNNLMCIKPQEPDKDDILKSLVVHYNVSKQGSNSIKSTNTLTDYSGNNRHATCKNFNWVNTQFVDDGKAMRFDDNGSCIVGINMPQLDKYTVIAKRRWIDKKSENKWFCSLGNGDYTSASQSLFWFEGGLLNNVFYTYNKGYKNPIVLPELISIQSSDDYNGVRINSSNGVQAGNKLFIGSVGENDNTHVVADFYQLLLFDRVLTDEEREWVKENLIEPDTVSAAKACTALFEPENLEITDEYPTGIIRDSLGGDYYMVAHSDDYTIENGLMKSTDNTFLVSIENANENDVKAMIIDMYYDSTVPGSYLNGEYTEGSVKLTNRRIMGINNPTTTSIFQDLMQVLETGFTIGKVALYNKELTKDEFDSEAFHKGFAVRHSTFEKNASTHLFRDGHKELTPGEYLLPFETLYLRVDVPEGYTMQDYVFDEIEQSWKPNTPKSYICPEHDFHIIAMGEQMKVIKNWSPLASISTFGFRATDNQVEFAGSTDGGTMSYILDDTDVTKFTIEYTNTAGEGNVYLIIGDRQYDVISGQPQTYSVSGAVKLDFLNMEEVANFAGTIKFTNVV